MHEIHSGDLVLVAVMPSPKDLEIARVLGWYRIPLESAPKAIRVDWLAFYQTAAFGDDKWRVRFVAPVAGFELVLRSELLREDADHPRADAPYYKIQLGSLQELAQPIEAGPWRRFTFLYTTGERLLNAATLGDLTIPPSKEHDRLWRIIRERSA